jgi:hypothetical protein
LKHHQDVPPPAIICDVDGTIALLNERNPYEPDACDGDEPNWPVVRVLKKFNEAKILFVSGREEKHRARTKGFLINKAHIYEPFELWMRANYDKRKDVIVKAEIFAHHILGKYEILFVFDDRKQIVRLWRSLGLTCFQVSEGNF